MIIPFWIRSFCIPSVYILMIGPQNRTLYLYAVRPTNLLVFGLSRANAETSYSCR